MLFYHHTFKDIPRTAWNFQTNSRYNTKTFLLTLYKTGIGNVTLIGVVHYIKHHTLVKSITKEMGANVQILGEQSGLHIVLCVNNSMNENELIESAKTKR